MAGQEEGNLQNASGHDNDNFEPFENSDQNVVVEEYNQLDSKLDELNSALDFLEQKNDDIQAKLKVLLKSNIEIRQQIQEENKQNEQ